MSSIRKLPSGKYQAIVRKQGFPPQYKSFSKRKDAVSWSMNLEAQLDKAQAIGSDNEWTALNLSDAIDLYIKERGQHLKAYLTTDKYRSVALRKALGDIPLVKLSAPMIQAYKDKRLATVATGTARADLGYLQRVINFLRKDKQMSVPDLFSHVRLPGNGKPREAIPTHNQLARLLDLMPSDTKPIAVLASETGMRRGEILRLEVKDINLAGRSLRINEAKNGSPRVIPLSTKACQVLADAMTRCRGGITARLYPISPYRVSRTFREAADKLGGFNWVFHSLRHYACTRFFEIGLQAIEVATISGHKDMRMLQRYTHLTPSVLASKLG
ncbi:tyrosine-type recombinase/integrase [Serratia ficaria]|uniref:tyrosine-type recombinase/integrase n=1 Tax=Serratia ficaria TaxID=61651 RepID=UPI000A00D1CD|nr:site-specific integrase [Serratia ficaria]